MSDFKSLDRAIKILFVFNKTDKHLTAEQIADRSGLPRGSIYRYLNALMDNKFVERDQGQNTFRLGFRLLYFSDIIHYNTTLEKIAQPYMDKLARTLEETVQLTIRDEHMGIAINSVESSATIRVAPPLGGTVPLHAGANNKVILAFCDEHEWQSIFNTPLERFTDHTITDPEVLKRELHYIRRQGYAFSKEELHFGAWGVAAPIFNASGTAFASIGVSAPLTKQSETKQQAAIELTLDFAKKISASLGFFS
jgi:DNA-binding IclR family transcriptional regulator